MDYEAKRRQRRRAVIKATYDPNLADKLKNRSDKYIFENYGISVDMPIKDVPDLRRVPKDKKLRKRAEKKLRIEKFQYGVDKGLKPEHAKKLKYLSWENVKTYVTDIVIGKVLTPKQQRKLQWSLWIANEDFPDFIIDIVRNNNRWYRKNFAGMVEIDDSRFGWAVAHYVYVDGMAEDDVREMLQPSIFDADIYTDMRESFIFGG